MMLLTAVDVGLGACFFGLSIDTFARFREAFGIPAEFSPVGAVSIGYSDEPPADLRGQAQTDVRSGSLQTMGRLGGLGRLGQSILVPTMWRSLLIWR